MQKLAKGISALMEKAAEDKSPKVQINRAGHDAISWHFMKCYKYSEYADFATTRFDGIYSKALKKALDKGKFVLTISLAWEKSKILRQRNRYDLLDETEKAILDKQTSVSIVGMKRMVSAKSAEAYVFFYRVDSPKGEMTFSFSMDHTVYVSQVEYDPLGGESYVPEFAPTPKKRR